LFETFNYAKNKNKGLSVNTKMMCFDCFLIKLNCLPETVKNICKPLLQLLSFDRTFAISSTTETKVQRKFNNTKLNTKNNFESKQFLRKILRKS